MILYIEKRCPRKHWGTSSNILQQFLYLGALLRPSKVGRKTLRAFAEWVMLRRNDLLERWFYYVLLYDGMGVYSRVPCMESLIDFQDTLLISTFKIISIISIIPRSPKSFRWNPTWHISKIWVFHPVQAQRAPPWTWISQNYTKASGPGTIGATWFGWGVAFLDLAEERSSP